MKLRGSRIIKIECLKCGRQSPPFRVTLYEQDGSLEFTWKGEDLPQGWEIPDEEGLFDSAVYGYCMCGTR